MSFAMLSFAEERAPRHEIGLTVGGILSQDRQVGPIEVELGSAPAFQANYGYRFLDGSKLALYGEVHVLTSPVREVSSPATSLTRDVASAFVTPGLRLKFFPRTIAAPYFAFGGGASVFPASDTPVHGAFDYGGGIDLRLSHYLGLRGEVRDFYTTGLSYNNIATDISLHNVVAAGGIVLRFGQ
jgi:hypothetical protein